MDTLVHGWDMAHGAGIEMAVDGGMAADTLEVCRQALPAPEMRGTDFVDPVAVPADAGPMDQLVAFLGRTP
jgi:hypothetical protein